MADKQIRQPTLALQQFEQVENLILHRYVQRGDRLVADDQIRIERDGAGDADALALPAGKLVRIAVAVFARDADRVQQRAHARGKRLAGFTDPVGFQRLGDDFLHRHARIERGVRVLKDHLHAAAVSAKSFFAKPRDGRALEPHLACRGRVQADQRAAERRLATAGLAHQPQRFAAENLQRYV